MVRLATPLRRASLGLTFTLTLALTLILTLQAAAQTPSTLRVAVLSSRAAPFVLGAQQGGVSGLDLDVAREVADELGLRAVAVALPPLRLAETAGQGGFDLVCGVDPDRLPGLGQLLWSAPLAELPEVLAGTHAARPVDTLEELAPGTVIGTLLGQTYPALAAGLADGRWRREDALGEDRLLRKLLAQRHPYAVLAAGSVAAERELGTGTFDMLADWRLPLDRLQYRCGVPPNARVPASRIVAALKARQPAIARLLARGAAPPLAVVVSRASALRSLNAELLGELYLGRRVRLPDGSQPRLTMLRGPERGEFLALLKTNPAEFASRWAAQRFGGRLRPPDELADAAALRQRLLNDPQSLGYLPLERVDARLRIVHMQ